MQSLKDLDLTLEELLQWLIGLENTLLALESEPLPDSIELLDGLIQDHKDLMENTQKRQGEVDRVCKANQIKSTSKDSPRKISTKGATKGQAGFVLSLLHESNYFVKMFRLVIASCSFKR